MFSPDGKTLVLGHSDGLRLWDVAEQKEIAVLEGHIGGVSSVAFSVDGQWLASGGHDGTILLWELGTEEVAVEPKGKQFLTLGKIKHTALLQNFPNPFNPETWIPYHLAEAGFVEITIYTADGHLIRTLLLGTRPMGLYVTKDKAAYWDGRTDKGERVSSGLYFYRLRTGDFQATKKMTILK